MSNETSITEECCPKFDSSLWEGKTFNWENKKFIKGKVLSIFYMPINYGSVITKLSDKVKQAGAEMTDWLCLSDCKSKWSTEILLAVDKNIPEAENVTLSGKFMSKVYEGDFKNTNSWYEDFNKYVKENNFSVKKMFMWYTTCPKCAKKYGKNYVVIVGEVE